MPKPTVVPRWCTTGSLSEPLAGKKDVGFVPGEPPGPRMLNWILNGLSQWASYLDSRFDASSNLVLEANRNVIFSGTGGLKHGTRELGIASACFVPGMDHYQVAALNTPEQVSPLMNGSFNWTFPNPTRGNTVFASLPLSAGDRVLEIVWHFNKGSNATALTMATRRKNGTTSATLDTLSDVTSGASQVSVTRTINYTLVAGDAMFLTAVAGNSAHQLSHAIVRYSRP